MVYGGLYRCGGLYGDNGESIGKDNGKLNGNWADIRSYKVDTKNPG